MSGCNLLQILPPREFFVQRFTDRYPNNPHAIFLEGKTFLQQGEPKKAAKRFRKALQLQPDFIEARLGLAHAYRDLEYYADAYDLYKQVLAVTPANPQALEGAGVALARLRQYDLAEQHLRTALQLDPRSVSPLNALADLYYGQRQYARAIESWDRSLAADPGQDALRAMVEDLRGYVAKYGATGAGAAAAPAASPALPATTAP